MHPIFQASSLLSPTTSPTRLQHKRGPRMPKQRVAEDKFVKLLMFTGDPSAMAGRNTNKRPNQSETNHCISDHLPPLRCAPVLLSVLDTLHSSPPDWSSLLPSPPPRCCFFQWEESGDSAPEANASLRPPLPITLYL